MVNWFPHSFLCLLPYSVFQRCCCRFSSVRCLGPFECTLCKRVFFRFVEWNFRSMLDGMRQVFAADWFCYLIVHAFFQALVPVARHCVRSQGNDWNVSSAAAFPFADCSGGTIAVHFSHVDIHEY